MMRTTRPSTIAALLTVGLTLITSLAATSAAGNSPGALVQVAGGEREGSGVDDGLPRGIRTYGTPAVSFDLPELVLPGDKQTPGASATAGLKISGATMAGAVKSFAVTPDGTTAVFVADKETAGRYELYRTTLDGSSAPIKLSNGLTFGTGDIGVDDFQISADGSQVVFLADADHGAGVNDIYSVPIDGSATPVKLNDGTEAPVSAFGLSPDGTRTAFFGVDTSFGSGGVELYGATVGTASSSTQISDAGSAGGEVIYADFSPDGSRAIYAADAAAVGVYQWHSVPTDAAGPGSDVQLSSALSAVNRMAVSTDSGTVVYTADENSVGVLEVFSIPIGGGSSTQINPAMAGTGATRVAICPDGSCVAYLADQDTSDVIEVYRGSIGVGGSGTRLSTPMGGNQSTDTLNVSPDSTTLLYEADPNSPGTFELFRVAVDASAGPSALHGVTPPDNAGYFSGLGTPIVGRRAVYPVLGTAVDLFSVPYDGSASFTRVNDSLASGETVLAAFIPQRAERLLAYGVGASSDAVTRKLHAASIRGDLAPEQVNATAAAGSLGAVAFEINSTETYAVYVQDQDTAGKLELYGAALDSDADSVTNAVDNCPFVANSLQDAVTFGRTVMATDASTFSWGEEAEVRYARGPLAQVASLVTDRTGALQGRSSYTDVDSPAAGGTGFYYLFAPDCPGRSYQTSLGDEPQRDLADLP